MFTWGKSNLKVEVETKLWNYTEMVVALAQEHRSTLQLGVIVFFLMVGLIIVIKMLKPKKAQRAPAPAPPVPEGNREPMADNSPEPPPPQIIASRHRYNLRNTPSRRVRLIEE